MATYFETEHLPLVAATFDYFRLPPEKWPLLLARLAQLGLNTLIVPVPWSFHQLNQTTVDLDGATEPRRNLILLLKLCAALDFRCVLQTGPTLPNAGILNDGRPLWLAEATSPQLETALEGWLTALCRPLAKMQWPAGPAAALWLTLPQPVPLATDSQLTQVKWPIWLRKRYPNIDALNQAYSATYRTVSEVEFPLHWSDSPTPLATDARAFLAEAEQTSQTRWQLALTNAGWHAPVLPFDSLPEIKPLTLPLPAEAAIFNIPAPIEIDPCPPDICRGLVWASQAPLGSDGAPRPAFWAMRRQIWQTTLPAPAQADAVLRAEFDNGGLVLSSQPIEQKIDLPAGAKPAAFRLNFDGSVPAESPLVARGKLRADFRPTAESGPADLIFYLNDLTAPLAAPLAAYLRRLLAAQRLALVLSAAQAKKLSEALAAKPDGSQPPPPKTSRPPYTIAEARRGLSQAEAALKKAVASIGGLEAGFDTILGKSEAAPPQPVSETASVTAAIFEPTAQAALAEPGYHAAALVNPLKTAADLLQQILANPFTLEQYRQARQAAADAAQASIDTLLTIIEQLRLDIAAETLPLVAWRLHDQAQAIADTLRWGVLRR